MINININDNQDNMMKTSNEETKYFIDTTKSNVTMAEMIKVN